MHWKRGTYIKVLKKINLAGYVHIDEEDLKKKPLLNIQLIPSTEELINETQT